MSDQAEGLRELARGGAFESMGLPAVFDAKPLPDYSRLWLDLKAELKAEAEAWQEDRDFRLSSQFGHKKARAMLNRMLQIETMAGLK